MASIEFEGTVFTRESDGSLSKDTLLALKRKIQGLKRRKDPKAPAEAERLQAFIDAAPAAGPSVPSVPAAGPSVPSVPSVPAAGPSEPSVTTTVLTADDSAGSKSPPDRPFAPTLILSGEVSYLARVLEYVHFALRTENPNYNTLPHASLCMPASLNPFFWRSQRPKVRDDYYVSPKVDGERMLFAMCGFRAYNKPDFVFLSCLVSVRGIVYPICVESPAAYFRGTLLDGELDVKTMTYYPFDAIQIAGHDYSRAPYATTIELVQTKLMREVRIESQSYGMVWGTKPVVLGSEARSLQTWVSHHRCDGLIFTHSDRRLACPGRVQGPIYKWKMEPSIDLGVELSGSTFGYFTGKTWMPFEHTILLDDADRRTLLDLCTSPARHIFEFSIVSVDGTWALYEPKRASDMYDEVGSDAEVRFRGTLRIRLKLLRERRDKVAPNHIRTVMTTLGDCVEPLTWNDL